MSLQMNRVMVVFIGACVSFCLLASQCFAGAWTMPEGKFYERLSFNSYLAFSEFSMEPPDPKFKSFRDFNVGNYLEYGITDRFTLINAMYYKNLLKEEGTSETSADGFGDVDLGVRAKMLEGPWGVLSTQALVKIPGAYDKDDKLPLGNGQYDVDTRILYGRSLYPYLPGYCNVEVGYRLRTEDPSDELRYVVEFGMDFTKDLYGRIKLDGILSMDNGNRVSVSGNPTAANSYDLGKLDIAIGCKLNKRWGLEIACTPEIYGRNTTQGVTYTLALTYQTNR